MNNNNARVTWMEDGEEIAELYFDQKHPFLGQKKSADLKDSINIIVNSKKIKLPFGLTLFCKIKTRAGKSLKLEANNE